MNENNNIEQSELQVEQLIEDLEILADRIYAMDEDFTEEEQEEITSQLFALNPNQFKDAKSYLFANDELILSEEDYEAMQARAKLLRNKVLFPTERMDATYTRLFKHAFKIAEELDEFENSIESIEKEIAEKEKQIVEKYKDGIDTRDLADLIKNEYPEEYLNRIAEAFESCFIDKMAIAPEVEYCEDDEVIVVSFIKNRNDKIIYLPLLDILNYKIVYQTSFLEALNAVLMYKLIFGEDAVAC